MSKKLLWAVSLACNVAGGEAGAAEPGETTVGGKGYIDLTHIDQTSDAAAIDPTGTGVDAKRFYTRSPTSSTRPGPPTSRRTSITSATTTKRSSS
jgi:hypothetical protein